MIAIIDKNRESARTAIWSAYQCVEGKRIESSLKNLKVVLSPYWVPNYELKVESESEGAGVVVGFLNARYYDSSRGQFLSEDPVFWNTKQDLKNPQTMNSYSYGDNNPILKKDPEGKAAAASMTYEAALSLPSLAFLGAYIGPAALVVGVGAGSFAAGYYGTQYVLSNAPKLIETVSLTNYSELLFNQIQRGGPDDLEPPKNGIPLWQKIIYTGLGTGSLGLKLYDDYVKYKESIKNLNQSTNSSNQFSGKSDVTIQQRYTAVQNYNISTGASTGGGGRTPSNNSLWITPSGAVVTWSGSLVAGPIKK